jgi:hypothetical protein
VCALERELSQDLIGELRSKTLHKLGYGGRENVDPAILATLDEALDVAARVVRPNGTYRILPVLGTSSKGVRTEAGTIRSAMFTRLVEMCRGDPSVVFMMATLGEELENTCGADEPVSRQLLFDTVGSELAEMVADMLESDWRAHLDALGLQYTQRFSPGYCDWALDGQRVIAASLDPERVGVRLTSHFVMIPSKSVSAVAAVAKEVPIPVPCVFCAKDDCPWRRSPRRKSPSAHNDTCSEDAARKSSPGEPHGRARG